MRVLSSMLVQLLEYSLMASLGPAAAVGSIISAVGSIISAVAVGTGVFVGLGVAVGSELHPATKMAVRPTIPIRSPNILGPASFLRISSCLLNF